MTDIEKCQQIISDLEAKLARCKARSAELAKEREDISFAAHADGDAAARSVSTKSPMKRCGKAMNWRVSKLP